MTLDFLTLAIKISCEMHNGQVDKAGKPYILHPLRLMLKFTNEDEMIVAVLHDTIEDSNLTIEDLVDKGFNRTITDAVQCLTKRQGEDYSEFIHRVSQNKLATKIKIEDLKDNLNLFRLNRINEKDLARIFKYHNALKSLENL